MKLDLNGLTHPTAQVLALALLTAGEQAHSYSAFCPSVFTIRNWVLEGDPATVSKNVANLRAGYRPAVAFGLGLGLVVSFIARSPLPLAFALGTSVVMGSLYEQALPKEYRLKLSDWPTLLITGEVPELAQLPVPKTAALTSPSEKGTGL